MHRRMCWLAPSFNSVIRPGMLSYFGLCRTLQNSYLCSMLQHYLPSLPSPSSSASIFALNSSSFSSTSRFCRTRCARCISSMSTFSSTVASRTFRLLCACVRMCVLGLCCVPTEGQAYGFPFLLGLEAGAVDGAHEDDGGEGACPDHAFHLELLVGC